MNADNILAFLHLLAAFWYVMGLSVVQMALIRAWQTSELNVQLAALEEASHYQGVLLVPGAIVAVATGVFLWAAMDYNLISSGWLLLLEGLYIVTLFVCVPLIGMGLRRARLAALKARRAGGSVPELEQALADNVPLFFGGIATLLVPVMTYLSIFKPF